jgi:predicted RNA-binding Zn-ribbon protein involved in translation (DUF1610 family)
MAELVANFYEPGWRSRRYECDACQWRGDSRQMSLEPHEDQSEYSCPQCEDILIIVRHPSLDQVQEAAAQGHPEAVEQLALLEEYRQRSGG